MKPFGIVKAFALTALSVTLAAGCSARNADEVIACTMIGCESGLTIDVRGDRGGDITVKVQASDGGLRTFQCDADVSTCNAFFADFMPRDVTVTVTKSDGNAVRSYEVSYQEVKPNGENCPPVCRQGRVDVVL